MNDIPLETRGGRFGGSLKITDFPSPQEHSELSVVVTDHEMPHNVVISDPTTAGGGGQPDIENVNDKSPENEDNNSGKIITSNATTTNITPSKIKKKKGQILRWNYWAGKPQTEKTLWILLLLLLIAGLLISLAILGVHLHRENNGDVCLSQECVMTARRVLNSMDNTTNPCDDFFKFACGGWQADNPIPESSSNWDQFDLLREKMNQEIKSLLEKPPNPEDPESVLIAQQLYKMCISQDNKDNHTDLRVLTEEVVKKGQFEFPDDLGTALGRIRGYGLNFILSIYVFYDEKRPTLNTIYIDQPTFGLSAPHLLEPNNKFVNAYEDLITDVWTYVFHEETNSSGIARSIVDFERKLAQIATRMEKRRNRTALYNPMTLKQLVKILPEGADWYQYFHQVFRNSGLTIDWSDTTVIVKDIPYFKALGSVLSKMRHDIIRNYLRWRLIFHLQYCTTDFYIFHVKKFPHPHISQRFGNAVSTKFQQRIFLYLKATSGIQYPPPKWKVCSEWVNRNMGWAVSYSYVQGIGIFRNNFKDEVDSIVKDIREGFYEILQESDWIENQTKSIAFKKAQAMQAFIAYPEWLLKDRQALNNEFEGLLHEKFDRNHFENFLKIQQWMTTKSLKELNQEKDYSKWISYSTVVNAFYSASYNAIAFPAGILQIPFYGFPLQAMNYGGIGAVVGHELTHAFDDEGAQSDDKGRLINWWDKNTLAKYQEKARCFVYQYGNFSVPELNTTLNGINTQGENIADNGGLRQAFRGYKAYVKRNGPEQKLPGVNFTTDQLFFLSFAQSLCGSYRLENLQQQILTSRHSPWKFQVQGSVANSIDFAVTWKCPTPLEPCQICRIVNTTSKEDRHNKNMNVETHSK